MLVRRAAALLLCLLAVARPAWAARTDVVTLVNGDRITGEVVELERGRLQFKTDSEGTIYVEWDKVVLLEAARQFEVGTSDGRRFLGSVGGGNEGRIVITGSGIVVSVAIPEITRIAPIGESFWRKLDGSVDAGFNYTRSSGVAQTTVNSDTMFRRPAFSIQLTGSATLTYKTDDSATRSNQASVDLTYARYAGLRWFFAGLGRVETNESLGLVLRSQIAGIAGLRLVNTNRSQLQVGGGLEVNNEQGVDTAATQNIEGLLTLKASYYSYDHPKTNVDLGVQYYPSFSDWGRQRLQVNSAVKRELFNDFYVSLNVFDTFDSAPPNPAAARNDVGIVVSVGWSFGR